MLSQHSRQAFPEAMHTGRGNTSSSLTTSLSVLQGVPIIPHPTDFCKKSQFLPKAKPETQWHSLTTPFQPPQLYLSTLALQALGPGQQDSKRC